MDGTIAVRGLRDLQRAFKLADVETERALRRELREVAEPVRASAESLARANISRIGVPWSQMRTGVTTRVVYVAPKQRGIKSRTDRSRRRPNLADLLMGRSLEPALAEHEPQIVSGLEHIIDTIGRQWEEV